MRDARKSADQRGAAVLMALFVATLATLIVTGLFWTQFVVLRTIENQQIVSQSRLLLRGALDWARAILREDARTSNFDALTEPWAQPLEETRLDQLGETSTLAAQASLAGSIEDAQSRFNLRNLVDNSGQPVQREIESLQRLAELLDLPSQTADLIAERMQEALAPPPQDAADPEPRPLAPLLPNDIIGVRGVDPAAALKLADYVVLLDERTPVNVNTATAWVIAARIPGLSLSDASRLVTDRERVGYFKDFGDLRNRLARFRAGDAGSGAGTGGGGGTSSGTISQQDLDTTTRYFFVRGTVKLDRANTRMEALVKRGPPQSSVPIAVLWQREL